MNGRFAIFVVIGALVVMALYSASTNYVSALETNCYTFGGTYVCIHTDDSVKPPFAAITFCDDAKNCKTTILDKADVTPEVKNSIKNAQIANLGRDSSPDNDENSPDITNSTPSEPPIEPGKLEFPNLK
jgi:hypothetical protein